MSEPPEDYYPKDTETIHFNRSADIWQVYSLAARDGRPSQFLIQAESYKTALENAKCILFSMNSCIDEGSFMVRRAVLWELKEIKIVRESQHS